MGGICMGSYLNPGNLSFRGSLRSKIYVDKSELIAKTNEALYRAEIHLCKPPKKIWQIHGCEYACCVL